MGQFERGWRWAQRNPAVASLLTLVLLTLGTSIAWVLAVRADSAADRADGEAKEAKEARRVAQEKEGAAQQARAEEEKQRKAVEKARDEEKAAREEADRNLYYSRIALAQREWESGNIQNAREHLEATPPKLRHWEYSYLHGLAVNSEQTFRGHMFYVSSVAFSSDGQRLISIDAGEAKLWDRDSGREPAVYRTPYNGSDREWSHP